MKTEILYLAALLIAAGTAVLVTPLIRRLALHVGMMDVVDDRRMHEEPRPRIGGIAVYLGFAIALFATLWLAFANPGLLKPGRDLQLYLSDLRQLVGLLFGGTLILAVGLWDDIMTFRPRNKLIAQIIVALVSMVYGFQIMGMDNPLTPQIDWVDFPPPLVFAVTLLWYLGYMNAINFVDGLDGLLSGITAISGVFLFAIAVQHGHVVAALILCALVGGALGFLPYNFSPAKIILGDTGALFIGYVFASVSIIITAKVAVTVSLLVPLIALALPVLDTAAAIVRRARAGKAISQADRSHFHHVLVFRVGLSVRQAVLLIYAVTFVCGIVALALSGGFSHHPRIVNSPARLAAPLDL